MSPWDLTPCACGHMRYRHCACSYQERHNAEQCRPVECYWCECPEFKEPDHE